MKKNINIKGLAIKILYLVIIFNMLCLFIFILYGYKKYGFSSDSAVRVILAKEILDSGNYFPKDWFFVNGDIWLFSAHTIILPLLMYFSAGYSVYAFSSILISIAILLSVKALLVKLQIEKNNRLIISVIFTSGISLAITENLYGQISYGLIILYCCLILNCSILILSKNNKYEVVSLASLLILLIIITWSNPLRGLVYFIMPLVVCLIYYVSYCYKQNIIKQEIKYINQILLIIIISIVTGIVLNQITLNYIQMNSGVTQLQWISQSEMIRRIPKLFSSILFILGAEPYVNRSLFTLSGIYDGIRLVTGICFVVLIPTTIKIIFKEEEIKLKILAVFACSAFVIVALLMLSTNIYNARYLLPSIVLMVLVVYAIPFDFKNKLLYDGLRVVAALGFLTNPFVVNTGYWTTYYVSESHKDDSQVFNNINELASYMQSINLDYGYATFWNAGSLTVLSNNRVKTRQIFIENGIPQKFKWLSSNYWYEPSSITMKTFLLLTDQESKEINWKMLKNEYELIPQSMVSFQNYNIYIFNENISNKLKNWRN